jgi:methionyl aminopeptidase
MNKEKIIKAGEIAKQIKIYARAIVKKDAPLIEIAEKIEAKIISLGGKPAFPCNLSINNIAAHYTPSHEDATLAHGLLKVDFGVHADGWVADTALSFDLENSEENKKLIKSAESALTKAQENFKEGANLSHIGSLIEKEITTHGFTPIINLSGHEIKEYDLHAGITVPNIDDKKNIILKKGLYAIEPFASTGSGKVHDGKPSGIYHLQSERNVRSPIAREVLEFVIKEYKTLPFCSRWLVKKLGTKALFGLKQLEDNGNLHHYAQLVEKEGSIVSQAENTILVDKEVTITT